MKYLYFLGVCVFLFDCLDRGVLFGGFVVVVGGGACEDFSF